MIGRVLILLAGLSGAAGVALAAAAAHGGGGAHAQQISTMLLFHAPAILAIGLSVLPLRTILQLSACVLGVGLALFCLDLAVRDIGMARLFPMAAPIGGSAMILGWLGIALAAVTRRA